MSTQTEPIEKRQGATGVWTLVLKTDDGKVIATSEWGSNYEFAEKQWLELPLIENITV